MIAAPPCLDAATTEEPRPFTMQAVLFTWCRGCSKQTVEWRETCIQTPDGKDGTVPPQDPAAALEVRAPRGSSNKPNNQTVSTRTISWHGNERFQSAALPQRMASGGCQRRAMQRMRGQSRGKEADGAASIGKQNTERVHGGVVRSWVPGGSRWRRTPLP